MAPINLRFTRDVYESDECFLRLLNLCYKKNWTKASKNFKFSIDFLYHLIFDTGLKTYEIVGNYAWKTEHYLLFLKVILWIVPWMLKNYLYVPKQGTKIFVLYEM